MILNYSSMNAFRPLTNIAAYSASKAGITNFTAWLAVHMAQNYSGKIRAIAQAISETGLLTQDAVMEVLTKGLGGRFTGQKVLVLIPDHTRSLPLPELFRMVVLHDVRELNVMIALGTHPGYTEEGLEHLVGITAEEPAMTFRHVGLLNHAWDDPAALTSLGVLDRDEIKRLAGPNWHPSLPDEVNIRINKAVLEHDHIVIVGPTFPHEVVGSSGGAKYLFPGISGSDMINATHWLGALATVVGMIGIKETPMRCLDGQRWRRTLRQNRA